MGGKGSGRKIKFHDEKHKKWRDWQRQYIREIALIRLKHNCSVKEAQKIRNQRIKVKRIKRLEKELEEEGIILNYPRRRR